MADVSVQGMAAGFVALAIMLSIGTLILGGSIADCTNVGGYLEESNKPTSVTFTYGNNLTYSTTDIEYISGIGKAGVGISDFGSVPALGPYLAEPAQVDSDIWYAFEYETNSWAAQCYKNNQQAQAGYNLLIIALIVMAAAVIMVVVRHLSG